MIPLSNAAGTVKLVEQAEKLGRARGVVSELVIGSYTLESREGNSGRVYASRPSVVLNALGLPNPGIDYVRAHAGQFEQAHPTIVASVAGFSPDEFAQLALEAPDWAWAIELNLGCPNVWQGGTQKRIASFDPALVNEILLLVQDTCPQPSIRVKLSPISDPYLLAEVIAAAEPMCDAFVLSNTFPNGWLPDALDVPFGGVSGAAIKPIVLGQIAQARELTDRMLIASGGCREGKDILDYEAAGASMLQIGSRFLDGGEKPDVFTTLIMDAAAARA